MGTQDPRVTRPTAIGREALATATHMMLWDDLDFLDAMLMAAADGIADLVMGPAADEGDARWDALRDDAVVLLAQVFRPSGTKVRTGRECTKVELPRKFEPLLAPKHACKPDLVFLRLDGRCVVRHGRYHAICVCGEEG